jgi:hypothetical protein
MPNFNINEYKPTPRSSPASAALRNFAVSRHRLTGATNIAAICRHATPIRAGPLICSHNRQINYADALPRDPSPRARLPC